MDPERKGSLRRSDGSIAYVSIRKAFLLTIFIGIIFSVYIGIHMKHLDTSILSKFRSIIFDETPVMLDDKVLYEMSTRALSRYFQQYITTLQCFCKELKRFGNIDYGGFRICTDEQFRPSPGCLVYSYKHEMSERFDMHIKSKYNCKTQRYKKENFTLQEFKETLEKHKIPSILILKIDYQDFSLLSNFLTNIRSYNVRHIILEIHYDSRQETEEGYIHLLKGLKILLESKCRIYWYDRNWEFVSDKRTNHSRANCFTLNMFCAYTESSKFRTSWDYGKLLELPIVDPVGLGHLESEYVVENIDIFGKYVSKHQILCEKIRRIGNIVDGGWDICDDSSFKPRSPCIVYSFGINYDFSFDEDMEKTYDCEVFAFDPSMRTGDYNHTKRIHFYEVGIGDGVIRNGTFWEFKTLQTIMRELGHEYSRIDVLKMDIEGNEKQCLVDMISSGSLKNVAQLCIEFHTYYDIGAIRKLYDIGFRIFWSHQNPGAPLYKKDETLSYGNEVSFVNINIQ